VNADVIDLKQNLTAGGKARVGEIFDDFMLGVDGDSFSSGQILEIDAMTASMEAQLDSMMNHAFALHPFAHPGFCEQINRPLFQNAGADAFLDILPAAIFDHDRFNSLQLEKVGKRQTSRSRAYDSDLGT